MESGRGTGFDSPPYVGGPFPIVDSHRFFGFDLFCAWQDVYLMSLMFFLSGLFVWPSLMRKRDWGFLRDRVLRLGLPLCLRHRRPHAVGDLSGLSADRGRSELAAYWHSLLALPFWPNGPLWFLWQLLALNIVAASGSIGSPRRRSHRSAAGRLQPVQIPSGYYGVLLAVSALAYVPLALAFTPWTWSDSGIFRRPIMSAAELRGLFLCRRRHRREQASTAAWWRPTGLARRWAHCSRRRLLSLFLWMGLTGLTMNGRRRSASKSPPISASCWPAPPAAFFSSPCACASPPGIRGFSTASRPMPTAFIWCITCFVVWLQYALLARRCLPSSRRLVFGGTLVLSVATIFAAQRLGWGARLIGTAPRAVATS